MVHACPSEVEELVQQDVMLTLFHDNAKEQIENLSKKLNRAIPVQLYIETGMNRRVMPAPVHFRESFPRFFGDRG
jgi:alanine racemase